MNNDLLIAQAATLEDISVIAEKAGITVGNIYRYFKDKDDLNAHIIST